MSCRQSGAAKRPTSTASLRSPLRSEPQSTGTSLPSSRRPERNARSPELQAVDISRTPYVGSLNALNPEAQAGLQRAADLAAIADWARAEGLTGLSPASLKPSAASDATIADWARAEGLTGLSPASLKPSAASDADAIAALPHDQLVAMFGNVG